MEPTNTETVITAGAPEVVDTPVETIPEPPAFGEKTCEICGCKMSGPGVNENSECAEKELHPEVTTA